MDMCEERRLKEINVSSSRLAPEASSGLHAGPRCAKAHGMRVAFTCAPCGLDPSLVGFHDHIKGKAARPQYPASSSADRALLNDKSNPGGPATGPRAMATPPARTAFFGWRGQAGFDPCGQVRWRRRAVDGNETNHTAGMLPCSTSHIRAPTYCRRRRPNRRRDGAHESRLARPGLRKFPAALARCQGPLLWAARPTNLAAPRDTDTDAHGRGRPPLLSCLRHPAAGRQMS